MVIDSKIFTLILAFVLSLDSILSAQSEYEIDFSDGNGLEHVFKSGLPLKPVYGFENSLIEFGISKVRVILADGVDFSVETDSGRIRVLGQNQVSFVSFVSSMMKLDDLSEVAMPYIDIIGGDVGAFKKYLDTVKSNPVTHDQNFVIERQVNDVALGLSFRKTYDSQSPLKLDIGLFWLDIAKQTEIRQQAIEPPPGWSWAADIPTNADRRDVSPPSVYNDDDERSSDLIEKTENSAVRNMNLKEAEPDEEDGYSIWLYVIAFSILAIGLGTYMHHRR